MAEMKALETFVQLIKNKIYWEVKKLNLHALNKCDRFRAKNNKACRFDNSNKISFAAFLFLYTKNTKRGFIKI